MAGSALSEPPPLTVGAFLLHLWRLSRPEAWLVSILPAYVGIVIATREVVPGWQDWTHFWDRAAFEGATTGDFLFMLQGWLSAEWRFLAMLLVMGPLAWTATLLMNDVHDLPADRANPRKARSPLVQGLITANSARAGAYVAAALALGLAMLVRDTFALLVLGCLVLAWAYSVPPVRLKIRPGADVAVNALGIGGLSFLAGWSLVAPLATAPWLFLPQGLLVAVAIYVPTTLVDHEADKASGFLTLATHLGVRRAYLVGWTAWILCNAGALAFSWNDVVIPRRMFPILAIFVPLLLYQYHAFIGRATSPTDRIKGIILCSLTFLCVNLVFVLMYTQMWIGGFP